MTDHADHADHADHDTHFPESPTMNILLPRTGIATKDATLLAKGAMWYQSVEG